MHALTAVVQLLERLRLTEFRESHRFNRAIRGARENVTDRDVERHLGVSYDVTMDLLRAVAITSDRAVARALDPNGAMALRAAKRLRRRELAHGSLGSPTRLLELAEEHFGVRSLELGHWAQSRVDRPWLNMPELPAADDAPLIALSDD